MASSTLMETPDINQQFMSQVDDELGSPSSFRAAAEAANSQVVNLSDEDRRAGIAVAENQESPEFGQFGNESPLFENEGGSAPGNEELTTVASSPPDAAMVPRPKTWNLTAGDMEGIGFDQINSAPVTCIKCKYPISEPFKARKFGKQGQNLTFVCRLCGNIISMVYRKLDIHNLDEAGMELSFLKGSEADSFFAQAKAAIGDSPTLQWDKLRECLIQHFVSRKISRRSILVEQEQLPLSVWATRGFDVEAIKRGGSCFPHPDFGEVWTTPLKTISHEQVTIAYLILLAALLGTHIWVPPWIHLISPPHFSSSLISPPRSPCTISP
jgi:hypothetical protein